MLFTLFSFVNDAMLVDFRSYYTLCMKLIFLLFTLDKSSALWESWIVVLRGKKKRKEEKTGEIFLFCFVCLFLPLTCSITRNKVLLSTLMAS